jgi:hypothetical protein
MGTILIKAMMQGDGYKRSSGESVYSYRTSNSLLADDTQILVTLMGYEASKSGPYIYPSSFSEKGSSTYHVHVNRGPAETRVNTKSNVDVTSVIDTRVVCFELPNNTVITRRSGKVSLHRQCKHAMHIVRLLRMAGEVLDTGVVNVKRADAQELLDIRSGKWKYEELLEWSEYQDNELDKLYKTSSLPDKVNIELASKVLLTAEEMANT